MDFATGGGTGAVPSVVLGGESRSGLNLMDDTEVVPPSRSIKCMIRASP